MSEFSQQDESYNKLVERYSRYIKSPVLRLRFLNSALKLIPERDSFLFGLAKHLPLVGTLSERAMLVVEVSRYLPANQSVPLALRMTSLLYRVRIAVYAGSLVLLLGFGAGVVYLTARLVGSLSIATEAKDAAPGQRAPVDPPQIALVATGSELPPERVWLAEQGDGYEFYSNGARILTELETDGPRRRFYRFDLDGENQGRQEARPVGIVYHLSEGDQLPFSNQFNSSLKNASRGLLEYSKEHRLYNYVIDRFGRIYRVVRDEYAADHAGSSLWSDGHSVYISLSASFIGICLEGKSRAQLALGPDGITEAQIYAARVLTAVLRSKWGIADANCVTHGLVSLNPSNRLLGYHTDWVAGFPFEALGLSNKYQTELVAISRFGFSYDRKYLFAAGGKTWPGLELAETQLRDSAKTGGSGLEHERRRCWDQFQRAYRKQQELNQQPEHSAD